MYHEQCNIYTVLLIISLLRLIVSTMVDKCNPLALQLTFASCLTGSASRAVVDTYVKTNCGVHRQFSSVSHNSQQGLLDPWSHVRRVPIIYASRPNAVRQELAVVLAEITNLQAQQGQHKVHAYWYCLPQRLKGGYLYPLAVHSLGSGET